MPTARGGCSAEECPSGGGGWCSGTDGQSLTARRGGAGGGEGGGGEVEGDGLNEAFVL